MSICLRCGCAPDNCQCIETNATVLAEAVREVEQWKNNHARCMRKLASALESLDQCQAESNRHVDQIVSHSDTALAAIQERDTARAEVERVSASYFEVASDLRSQVDKHSKLKSTVCQMLAMAQERGMVAPDDFMAVLRRLDEMAEYKQSPAYLDLIDKPETTQLKAGDI